MMAVMVGIAVMPVPVMRPAVVGVPPSGPIAPIPRRMPCVPSVAPKPVIDNRSVDINRLYHIVGAIYIFVAYHLNGYHIFLVFLHVDGCHVLIDILCENRLQDNQTLVTFTGLYHAQVIHFSVSVQIQIAECAVRLVELHLELLKVLSFRKELSYNLQVESFRDVCTLGGDSHRLFRP